MEISRIALLSELYFRYEFELSFYSEDFLLESPKKGYESQFDENRQKLNLIKELLNENETDEEEED